MPHQNTPEVVNKLCTENIRLAQYFGRKFQWVSGYNESLSIALQALLKAANEWEESRGPFGTWAGNRMRWLFRVDYNSRRARKRGGAGVHGRGTTAVHVPLDAKAYEDGAMTLGDVIADESVVLPGHELGESEEAARNRQEAQRLLALLAPRDRKIMEMRFGFGQERPMILEEIAKVYGLTRERVRQIEAASLRKFWREKNRKTLVPVTAADLQAVAVMIPQEAGDLLKWFAGQPARVHRYRLEGGTRRRFDCLVCRCATEAHSPDEAGANLTEYGRSKPTPPAVRCCGDHAIVESGVLMPPLDFS